MRLMSSSYQGNISNSSLLQNPAMLLLLTGTLIGLNFPLAKVAGNAGIPPLAWVMLISLGSCVALLPVLISKRRLAPPRGRMLRYALIAGPLSFAAPNLLVFGVVPYTGAGYAGLMFALSPVFTLSLAALFRLNPPGRLGIAGVATGLVGAAIVSLARGSAPGSPPMLWLAIALLIPVVLALGNIYRTLDWPPNALPDVLAFWSHAFAAVCYLAILITTHGTDIVGLLAPAPLASIAQLIVAGLTAPVLFRLQQLGGPVLLSQIGYVSAAVSLVVVTLFLGERYSSLTWFGAGVIGIGIIITLVSRNARG